MIDSRDPWARILFALFVPVSSYIVSTVVLRNSCFFLVIRISHLLFIGLVSATISLGNIDEAARLIISDQYEYGSSVLCIIGD